MLGASHNVGKYTVADENGRQYELIYFGNLEAFHTYIEIKFGSGALDFLYQVQRGTLDAKAVPIVLSVVYYPNINEYRGTMTLQMVMKYYQ